MDPRRCPPLVPLVIATLAMSSWNVALAAAAPEVSAPAGGPSPFRRTAELRYHIEYPAVNYTREPTANPVARLQERLDRGEVVLRRHPVRGYLDSVLEALDISHASQTLVWSRTSLQVETVRAASPRAIYFNEDTYVAWVQRADLLEIGTMDAELGPVFYTLPNAEAAGQPGFARELERCLSCHDQYLMTGGGVPRFIVGSSYVDTLGQQLTHEGRILTTDRTHLRFRWGGWYVTGRHGDQVHLGNIHVREARELVDLEGVRRGNVETLDGLFDTTPYLTNHSDIVAHLVMQHQIHVQHLMTRVNFEVRTALAREGALEDPGTVAKLREHMDALLGAMLFSGAAPITGRITGGSGFDAWFEARGPRDPQGRSLRELDLETRLFRHPLSFLIHSPAFDALPEYARSYLYGRLQAILDGSDRSESFAHLSAADRSAILGILRATKPEFAARHARPR